MRFTFILIILISCSLYSSAQLDKYVGTYVGTAQTDSAYGMSIGHTVSMTVNLMLNADSTYKLIWYLDFKGYTRFDSPWYNTGKWTAKKNILFFTIDEDENYYETGKRFIPYMHQDGLGIINKKEIEMIKKFMRKHDEYINYLKIENESIITCNAGQDCTEEVWKNHPIIKI